MSRLNLSGGKIVLGARTIKTLTALLVSMTLGAFALMVLETAPVQPEAQHLAAVGPPAGGAGQIIRQTLVPIQPIKWRNIVVHSSAAEAPDIASRCHFVVTPEGQITPTSLWQRQLSGHHVYVPGRDFNADSIGICLIGDFSRNKPPRKQLAALIDLTRAFQPTFRIPADRVYLHSDLDAYSRSPGAAFPSKSFDRALYRPKR